jgi:hypothetical protein
MNKEKICFKSDGTKETGVKIIKTLEELGGVNYHSYEGIDEFSYYCIDSNNYISVQMSLTDDNILKDIHTWKQELSKEDLLEKLLIEKLGILKESF